jgi:hypothetical protein
MFRRETLERAGPTLARRDHIMTAFFNRESAAAARWAPVASDRTVNGSPLIAGS